MGRRSWPGSRRRSGIFSQGLEAEDAFVPGRTIEPDADGVSVATAYRVDGHGRPT